ncbi:hypothetical protein SAMN05421848_0056 [Kushneria avicenniae]|uniref:Uncharacterized protein n=1 Tax=Kushneria avicenniae TaxID=402385 RepID=A0A1I1FAV8_9GAMM|nr:hypothetical protein [Kushneria avicenniae]SFB96411.1 hypothetical protein SAMN05421848_0056 [Kushneria avicenniae]
MLYRAHSPERLPADSDILINEFLHVDRRPRNTHYPLHLIMGLWFHQKFGRNFRGRAYFCTGSIMQARDFGSYVIELEPVGDYELCFSRQVDDLYLLMQQYGGNTSCIDNLDSIFDTLESFNFQYFKNGGLEEAAASDCEVMLYAKQYRFKSIQ